MLLQGAEGRRHLGKGCTVAQGPGLALDDGQIMPPVVDRPAETIMRAGEDPAMFADRLPLGDDDDPVGINTQADRAVRKGRRHAVTMALQMDQAGRGDALGVLDEAIEGARHRHQVPDLLDPRIGDCTGLRAVRGLRPQLPAPGLQPGVQCLQRREVRQGLPEPMPGILYVLLDLPLLPAGSRVAELGLEQEVADHGREADVDLAVLATADFVDGRLHIVVDAPLRHAAQHPEGVVMGIEQHLMGLEQVGT